MPIFVYVLALAIFAQGTSEFMLSGLVSGIAHSLSVSVEAAAALTSAYAIGMILGAPLMAAWSSRWPRRRALAVFLAAFVVVHVVGAITTNFPVLFASRIVAAVANAGFLAIAMSVAATLAGPKRQHRATTVLLSGVTLSCVAGVPGGALLAEWSGWRSAFWVIAGLCLPALVLVFRAAPADAAGALEVSIRTQLRALRSRRVQLILLDAALVNGATFATFAYLAVIATHITYIPTGIVPGLLAVFGAGAFVGVTAAGRVGAGRLRWGIAIATIMLPVGWTVLVFSSSNTFAMFVVAAVMGCLSFGVGSTLVGQVMQAAAAAPSLNGSFATVALNTGAFVGPLLAGAIVGAIDDYRGAIGVSIGLALIAAVFAATRAWSAAAKEATLR